MARMQVVSHAAVTHEFFPQLISSERGILDS